MKSKKIYFFSTLFALVCLFLFKGQDKPSLQNQDTQPVEVVDYESQPQEDEELRTIASQQSQGKTQEEIDKEIWGDLTKDEMNKEAVASLFIAFLDYHEANRSEVLEAAMVALKQRGAQAVPYVLEIIDGTSVYDSATRSVGFLALGELGNYLANTSKEESQWALDRIYERISTEARMDDTQVVELPSGVSEEEKAELVHQGNFVEEGGQIVFNTFQNRVAALDALKTINT